MISGIFYLGKITTEIKRRYKEKYYMNNNPDGMQLVAKIINVVYK